MLGQVGGLQLPVSLDGDDQDFMPNKRPRTLCKRQNELVRSSPACIMACKPSSLHSIGKENQPPISYSAESCLKHKEQEGQLSDGETLPLRTKESNRNCGAGSLLVRSFFTKTRHTPSNSAPSSSATAGSPAEPAKGLQLEQPSQWSTTLRPLQQGTACIAGPACTAGPASTAGPVPSPLPGDFIVLDASDSDEEASDGEFADLQTQAVQSEQAVLAWLHQHGLVSHAAAFSQAEVDMDLIPCLTDADLKLMGVTALGPRRKILAAASKLSAHTDAEEVCKHEARLETAVGKVSLHSGHMLEGTYLKATVDFASVCA